MDNYLSVLEGGFSSFAVYERAAGEALADNDASDGLFVETESGDEFRLVADDGSQEWFHWEDENGALLSQSFFIRDYPELLVAKDEDGDGDLDLFIGTRLGFGYHSINIGAEIMALQSGDTHDTTSAITSLNNIGEYARGSAFAVIDRRGEGVEGCPPVPYFASAQELSVCVQALSEEIKISDGTYWFPNYVSNEIHQNEVAARIDQHGGAYIGVGPDQNYSFIAQSKPAIAFIIDIRRDNLLQHLIYKAVMAESPTRREFLTHLLMRRPLNNSQAPTATKSLLDAIERQPPLSDHEAFAYADAVSTRIQSEFGLDSKERQVIDLYLLAFRDCGFGLGFEGCGNTTPDPMLFPSHRTPDYPTWRELILRDTNHSADKNWLGSEENYQYIRWMHANNRIIPVVGDFTGPDALRRIGSQLKTWGIPVRYFYTSNVEMWLHRSERASDQLRRFYNNVASLPVDSSSLFIRVVTSPSLERDVVGRCNYAYECYPTGFVPIQTYLERWAERDFAHVDLHDYLDRDVRPRPIVFEP